jgi:hypothetical protein
MPILRLLYCNGQYREELAERGGEGLIGIRLGMSGTRQRPVEEGQLAG